MYTHGYALYHFYVIIADEEEDTSYFFVFISYV